MLSAGLAWIVCAAVTAGLPRVEVQTLAGEPAAGELVSLDSKTLKLRDGSQERELPLDEILEVRFPDPQPAAAATTGDREILLLDGTRLSAASYSVSGKQAVIETTHLGTLKIPLAAIASVRLGPAEGKLAENWQELLAREFKQDMLIIAKGEVLDRLDGVIGEVDAQSVKFALDGDVLPVKLEKVYGLIYYHRERPPARQTPKLLLVGGDSLAVSAIRWDGSVCRVDLAVGGEVEAPIERLRSLDLSGGKLAYLSQLEPREVKYVPFFDVTWKYRRDRNLDGGPLRLGGKTYARGLCLHSRTLLKYRLGAEYRRFQAVLGIDELVAPRGDVHVVLQGDGKVLWDKTVKGSDSPQPVDLDVSGVRELEILVDFGGDLDIADHFDLADAKVIK